MSLSRYFKNAPSFQAEDLVKQTDTKSSGWTPNPRKDSLPFQTQKAPLPAASRESFPEKVAATPRHKPLENNTGNGNLQARHPSQSSANDNTTLPLDETPADLSGYIDRAEAERNATEAYRIGLEEGREKADQDFGTAAMALLLACQQMDTLRATIIGNSSKELLDFSLAMAERIIRYSVRQYDHTIVATVEEALRRAVKSDEFTIYIHPDDYDTLAEKSAEIIAGLSGLNNIVIKKDATVERGGAMIESDNCTLDATISGQFEVIKEQLQKKNS